jgi:hypothetical protein
MKYLGPSDMIIWKKKWGESQTSRVGEGRSRHLVTPFWVMPHDSIVIDFWIRPGVPFISLPPLDG